MIKNAVCYLFAVTQSKNAEGMTVNTFTFSSAFRADVQPASLSQAQLQVYGLSTQAAQAKKVFTDEAKSAALLQRVFVDQWYEIRGLNTWPAHQEIILAPVQSSIQYSFAVSAITVPPTAGAIYSNNGVQFTVKSTALVLAGGKYSGTIVCSGPSIPQVSGILTKVSGTGDASVLFTGYTV